jgi:hypothetical protein
MLLAQQPVHRPHFNVVFNPLLNLQNLLEKVHRISLKVRTDSPRKCASNLLEKVHCISSKVRSDSPWKSAGLFGLR